MGRERQRAASTPGTKHITASPMPASGRWSRLGSARGSQPMRSACLSGRHNLLRARAAIDGLAGANEMVTAQMSLAKGVEFRAVVVMACDEGVLPLDERVADAADEAEPDDIYETERRLLYVACTRAREHLLLTGVTPVSEYLADFNEKTG
jgi:hypothetical protein